MRQVTADACDAFEDGRKFRSKNTAVEVEGDTVVLYLHDNAIAKREDGKLFVRTAGWATTTTKERLNGLAGVDAYTHRKVLHLNGKPWDDHAKWTEIKKGEQS